MTRAQQLGIFLLIVIVFGRVDSQPKVKQASVSEKLSRIFKELQAIQSYNDAEATKTSNIMTQLREMRALSMREFQNLNNKIDRISQVMEKLQEDNGDSSDEDKGDEIQIFDDRWGNCKNASCVRQMLKQFNKECLANLAIRNYADFRYSTNITTSNRQMKSKVDINASKWDDKMTDYFRTLLARDIPGLTDTEIRIMKIKATSAQSSEDSVRERLSQIRNNMGEIYSTATVSYNGKKLEPGESGVLSFFDKSRNCSALASVWKQWRDAIGKKTKSNYTSMVRLLNKGARENNYRDIGYYEWFSDFQDPRFDEKVMNMYEALAPMYKEIHAYARYKLKQNYPGCIDENGPLPAHLLGDVWGQEMTSLYDILKPYPVGGAGVDAEMKKQSWTIEKIFKTAEDFFVSLGFAKLPKKFWTHSMFKKPKDRKADCHPTAFGFGKAEDVRILMCTTITERDLATAHHELGHLFYYMAYQNQPCAFHEGANSGFHEAIGDTISKSVSTNNHLIKIKLLKNYKESKEANMNFLLKEALKTVSFLPYALVVDTWRWRVFNGSIKEEAYNSEWWKLRKQLQGVVPPVSRSENDFDAAAKYHVTNNIAYIRYFTSYIMTFQFYEAMCKASGYKGPIFTCDFYNSKEAGKLLKLVLSLGRSKPWPEIMKIFTGQTEISLDPLNRYFEPLLVWLRNYRREKGYKLGW